METSILNRADASADVDLSIFKVISFIALTVISAGVAGYFIAEASFLYGLLALVFFWILFVLQTFFIKGWPRILPAIFLESAAMLLPSAIIFRENFSGFVFLALGLLFALLLSAESAGRNELANALKIPFWRTARHVASKAVSSTLIFIAVVYLLIAGKSIVEKQGVQFVSDRILTPMMRTVIPEFTSKMSIDDLLLAVMEKQVGKEAFQRLTPAQKAEALRSSKAALANSIGEIDTKAPLGTALYNYFADKLTSAPLGIKVMVGLVLITTILGLVKLLALIFFMPVAALAALVYEILIVLNFVAIQYESRSREIILLK